MDHCRRIDPSGEIMLIPPQILNLEKKLGKYTLCNFCGETGSEEKVTSTHVTEHRWSGPRRPSSYFYYASICEIKGSVIEEEDILYV